MKLSKFPEYVKITNTVLNWSWYFKHINNGSYEEVLAANNHHNNILREPSRERKTISQLLDHKSQLFEVIFLTDDEFNIETAIYYF